MYLSKMNILLKLLTKRNFSKSRNFIKGDVATIVKKITMDDIMNFTKISGDTNPIHSNNNIDFNNANKKKKAIVHGALLNSILSSVIGTKLPGYGTIVISQNLNFPNKCYADDVVTFKVELIENRKIMTINFICEVENEKRIVLYGDAKVIVKRDII